MKLGDVIAAAATPIAQMLNMPCIDPVTNQLRPESNCNKRREHLNQFSDAVYEFFSKHNNNGQKGQTMEFLITRTVLVEAETPEDAVIKSKPKEGSTVAIGNVIPKPNPQPQQVPGRVVTGGFQQSTTAAVPALPGVTGAAQGPS